MRKITALLVAALFAATSAAQVVTDPDRTGIPTGGGGGSGTVTSVSVTTANGVSGSVANSTTTPAISLTLGAISPSSVNSTGPVTGTAFFGAGTGLTGTASALIAGTASVAVTAQTATVAISAQTATAAITAQTATAAISAQTATVALTANTAAALTVGRTIAITGDLVYTSPSFDGSGNVTGAGTLATVNSNVGSFTNASVTVNEKGLVTAASSGTAPVTSVAATGTNGLVVTGSPITTAGTLGFTLPTIVTGTGSFAGPVSLPDTTAAVPSLRFSGSVLTGFRLNSANNGGRTYYTVAGGDRWALDSSGLILTTGTANCIKWTTGTDPISTTYGTGLCRNADGVIEFNGGTAGTISGDAKLRHIIAAGTAPTVGGSCGTSPTIAGGDTAFIITVGTVSATSCTATFGTAFANAPVCTANAQTTTGGLNVNTTTGTAVISAAALTVGEKLFVTCIGI